MFKQVLIVMAMKAIELAMCQFFGACKNSEDCPDGVCEPVLDSLSEDTVNVNADDIADSKGPQALFYDLQWDKLQPLVEAATAFVAALRAFFGATNRVG